MRARESYFPPTITRYARARRPWAGELFFLGCLALLFWFAVFMGTQIFAAMVRLEEGEMNRQGANLTFQGEGGGL